MGILKGSTHSNLAIKAISLLLSTSAIISYGIIQSGISVASSDKTYSLPKSQESTYTETVDKLENKSEVNAIASDNLHFKLEDGTYVVKIDNTKTFATFR